MEGDLRLIRGIEHPVSYVLEAVEGIVELKGGVGKQLNGHRIGLEVAPDKIAFQGVTVNHLRIAGLAVIRIGTEGSDLNLLALVGRGDGTEVYAGIPHGFGPLIENLLDHLRTGRGSKVQVISQAAQERIAHRAAHEVERVAARGKFLHQSTQQAAEGGDGGFRAGKNAD